MSNVRVRPPETTDGVELLLVPAVSVRVRYEGEAESCDLLVTMNDATLSYVATKRGLTEAILVPPGHLEIRVEPKEEGLPYRVQRFVEPGSEVEIVLE